jgi:hypothetical protein
LVSCSGIQWWGDQLSVKVRAGYSIVEPQETLKSLLDRVRESLRRHAALDEHGQFASASGEAMRELT